MMPTTIDAYSSRIPTRAPNVWWLRSRRPRRGVRLFAVDCREYWTTLVYWLAFRPAPRLAKAIADRRRCAAHSNLFFHPLQGQSPSASRTCLGVPRSSATAEPKRRSASSCAPAIGTRARARRDVSLEQTSRPHVRVVSVTWTKLSRAIGAPLAGVRFVPEYDSAALLSACRRAQRRSRRPVQGEGAYSREPGVAAAVNAVSEDRGASSRTSAECLVERGTLHFGPSGEAHLVCSEGALRRLPVGHPCAE